MDEVVKYCMYSLKRDSFLAVNTMHTFGVVQCAVA